MPNTQVTQDQRKQIYTKQINVLKQVQNLQNMEKNLYIELNQAKTASQRQSLILRINNLSVERMRLYENLIYYTQVIRGSVQQNRASLDNTTYNINLVEENMNKTKEVLDKNNSEQANQYRLIQINTYYGKKYAANTEIIKTIIFFMIPLLGLAILTNKSILNAQMTRYLSAVIIVIGIIVVGRQVVDIMYRNNMNFDKFDWNFNPTDQKTSYANVSSTSSENTENSES
jgi:hypothetical protein